MLESFTTSSLQISKLQSCKFSRFHIFKVSKIQWFKTQLSVCWKLLIPYYQLSILCFWKILTPYSLFFKNIFMLFETYWSHTQDFENILHEMELHDLSLPVFSIIFKMLDFRRCWDFPNHFFEKWFGICSWILWSVLVSQRINHIGFGAQGNVQKPRNHRNDGFSVFPRTKSKSY